MFNGFFFFREFWDFFDDSGIWGEKFVVCKFFSLLSGRVRVVEK